ncbi:hypothetical protein [Agaribacter marinus]|uniref:Rossmann fold nucleotide-binding protein n=1 Tax=Agaribacter marinus TaxID=1431249 RepID=A0AA37SYU2_9ALTE|nr:hypothetical protein [Agaribacter marinus]GLR70331.1 hypothetical protein GCM10007852_12390 [Agaribacter marinus]
MRDFRNRPPQISILGSAERGSSAYLMAEQAGILIAKLGFTLISGCGSPATRAAAQAAHTNGGNVISIVPNANIDAEDWPCNVLIPCGMGDARNLLMALSGDACIVVGGRAGTISEVCLAWLHNRPLFPLVGHGGWSESLPDNPPDERKNSSISPWDNTDSLLECLKESNFCSYV